MSEERLLVGWCYRRGGQTCGPVSSAQLKGLLALQQVHPREAVWKHGGPGEAFLTATAAVLGDEDETART